MHKFYVYLYSLRGVSLYVGKGTGKRAYDHLSPFVVKTACTLWAKKVRKLLREGTPPTCEILKYFSSEAEALLYEKELILLYGRIDIKTGTLYNTAEGGKGSTGHRMSKEGKQRIRQSMKGRHPGNKFALGLLHTQESKDKIAEAIRGRKETELTKQRKSQALAHQIPELLEKAKLLVSHTWWGPRCEIRYSGKVKRQSKSATHRLYEVELDGVVVLRTITDFRQGSCPKEFAHLKSKYQ